MMEAKSQIYLAPLQGFTDFYFRAAFHKYFGGVEQYFSPWIKPDGNGNLKKSQLKDIDPENNKGIYLVPQLMCNNANDFEFMAKYLYNNGYKSINWNLGCPYPMVTKRGLGSALLKNPDKIIQILLEVLPKISNKVSLKMRLGFELENEIYKLLPLLNEIPLNEIIIHARTANQMYKGEVNLDAFEKCISLSKHPLVYNGNLKNIEDYRRFKNRFPQINRWMIGRGIISNPFLPEMIKNSTNHFPENHIEKFMGFHQHLLENHSLHLSGEKHLLMKMKSYWEYFALSLKDPHKAYKRIKKSKTLKEYHEAVATNLGKGFIEF